MIVFVQMPYSAVEHPSIGLSLLQAECQQQGLESRCLYPNMEWRKRIGSEAYYAISSTVTEDLVGEWTFSQAAFQWQNPRDEDYLAFIGQRGGLASRPDAAQMLLKVREQVPSFIEDTAHRVLSYRPRIVGASSTFQQHCASLALLRRIKALDPSVMTVMGGANCEGEMGLTTVRNFEWLDYVVSGEADRLAVPFFVSILKGNPQPGHGVMSREWQGEAPRATFSAMDQVAIPEYADFFEALQTSGLDVLPGLLVETSRGCWWGQKHHCTFCGLNGSGMGYRSKSAERVLHELDHLSRRHALNGFEVVDNILDQAHLKSIVPALASRQGPYELFYETKSNLKREQMQLLAQAGIHWIQPGIESLNDEILKMMDKGSTAMMNVQLLQYAREFGVRVVWNFLVCFPGEKDEWYQEMADWLPQIHHLQPPNGMAPVRYDRFSPYHSRPEHYGISIQPTRTYRAVFPLPPEELEKLAYFFEDQNPESPRPDRKLGSPGRQALWQAIKVWRDRFWSPLPPILSSSEEDQVTTVLDTRPIAVQRRHRLQGRSRELLLECRVPRRFPQAEPELLELVQQKLVLQLGDRYLSLPVPGSLPSLPTSWQFPGGHPERPEGVPPYAFPELRRGVHA